jgi:chromosome segregation ATPase
MIEYTPILAATIPTAITGIVAYMLGRRKNIMAEKIAKSKTEAEIQGKALDIVKGVIQDMKDEFLREIKNLKTEIEKLTSENEKLKISIEDLETQLIASGKLSATLQDEITSLQRSLTAYKEENDKLKNL